VEEFEKEHNRETILEKPEMDKLMADLTNGREIWNSNKDDEAERLRFYNLSEEFYMHLCHIMKRHGLYFREGNDFGFAAGRR
jgi:hypothetical protein